MVLRSRVLRARKELRYYSHCHLLQFSLWYLLTYIIA